MADKRFYLGELFTGPGGFALGATQCSVPGFSIEHKWGVDIDPETVETYKANIEVKHSGKAIKDDAKEFSEKRLGDVEDITALAFGFPCNDFSMVGESKGFDGAYGMLYKAGVNTINKFNPKWFVAENVSGIGKSNQRASFNIILNELEDSGDHGYDLTVHLYKFEEYGIPQARHRYIIVGIRKDLKENLGLDYKVPAPTHGPGRLPYKTVAEAFQELEGKTDLKNTEPTRQTHKVIRRLDFTAPGDNAWKLDELVEMSDDDLMNYVKNLPWYEERHKDLDSVEAIRDEIKEVKLNVKSARMSQIYKRLEADKPAYTVTGSGGGGTHIYHWEESRALTNRERACLQTFPIDFEFKGKKESVRKQIGMAVPPEGSKVIFESILKTFAHIPYESVPASFDRSIEKLLIDG